MEMTRKDLHALGLVRDLSPLVRLVTADIQISQEAEQQLAYA